MRNRIEVVVGDITQEKTDGIVNAANSALRPGGGVDGAIHRAAGPGLLEELRKRYSGCPTGKAVVTGGHRLGARYIVHAVGPVWKGGDEGEDALLAAAYSESLRLAFEVGARRISFPAISTGAYGFPVERAARVAARAVVEALVAEPQIECVRFVCFDETARRAFDGAVRVTLKELGWEGETDERPGAGSGASSPRWMGSG